MRTDNTLQSADATHRLTSMATDESPVEYRIFLQAAPHLQEYIPEPSRRQSAKCYSLRHLDSKRLPEHHHRQMNASIFIQRIRQLAHNEIGTQNRNLNSSPFSLAIALFKPIASPFR